MRHNALRDVFSPFYHRARLVGQLAFEVGHGSGSDTLIVHIAGQQTSWCPTG